MIPELGNYALALSLAVAILLAIFPLWGAEKGHTQLMSLARPMTYALFIALTVAFLALFYAFAVNDFTVQYVVNNSNSQLPLRYRLSAVWGSHEGSLLLWIWLLTFWGAAVAAFSKQLPQEAVARVLGIMGIVSIGFLVFVLFTSNPFTRTFPNFPVDGRELNPLLQDVGLIFHPPLLYMGYVGFSVSFAFSIASLMTGKLDTALGALVSSLDNGGLGVFNPRYCIRILVGVLRTRLGRLVVLGSSRKCVFNALACRYGVIA